MILLLGGEERGGVGCEKWKWSVVLFILVCVKVCICFFLLIIIPASVFRIESRERGAGYANHLKG